LRNLGFGCALLGTAALSSAVTAASITIAPAKRLAAPARKAAKAKPRHATHPRASTALAALHVRVHAKPKKKPTAVHHVTRRRHAHVLRGARRIGASASLYERTTSVRILRMQGCLAGRRRTTGLVVLDFGKLAFRARRGGYGTVTFAGRFAGNRAITWALKSYARGYSGCLPRGSTAKITLARGTSNYDQDVPSTYTAGRLWAGATVALGNYLRRHHFDHVTAAAADDVEPAWDRGFRRTYAFFRGYAHADHGYLLYNYGSLDGGVGGIWKLRQAYYVSGGMQEARAVPEIYNHEMARQWADLAQLSYARYGRPIKLAGLMTQHWTSCHGCGYTAPKARHELVHELAKVTHGVPTRSLAAITNIGTPPPVDISN
jgi:hypothetical protein